LDKAAKEAKVKARREAARAADLADNVSDQDLARLEEEFWAATGAEGGARLRVGGGGSSSGGAEGKQQRQQQQQQQQQPAGEQAGGGEGRDGAAAAAGSEN
jgi:hypothetical protein